MLYTMQDVSLSAKAELEIHAKASILNTKERTLVSIRLHKGLELI